MFNVHIFLSFFFSKNSSPTFSRKKFHPFLVCPVVPNSILLKRLTAGDESARDEDACLDYV